MPTLNEVIITDSGTNGMYTNTRRYIFDFILPETDTAKEGRIRVYRYIPSHADPKDYISDAYEQAQAKILQRSYEKSRRFRRKVRQIWEEIT